MAASPVVDDGLPLDPETTRNLGGVDEIVKVHLSSHGHQRSQGVLHGCQVSGVAFLESQTMLRF